MSTNDPDEIRADIERTRAELSHDVDTLGDKVHPGHAVRRQTDKVRSGMGRVKDRVMGTAHDTMDSAHGTSHDLADRGREAASSVAHGVGAAPQKVREQTQGNPWPWAWSPSARVWPSPRCCRRAGPSGAPSRRSRRRRPRWSTT
nr:hypothetical protein GCM10025730_02430 [Promicromonospora thailandica]